MALAEYIAKAEALMARPDFKEQYTEYLQLRKYLNAYAYDLANSEPDRTSAALMELSLKFQMHATYGAGKVKMSKLYEYTPPAKPVVGAPVERHYFARLPLTVAMGLN